MFGGLELEPNKRGGCTSCNSFGDTQVLSASLANSCLGPINTEPKTSKNKQIIETVISQRIRSLEVDLKSVNLGWLQDVLVKMCAGIIIHLSPLPSPQLGAPPFLALLVADSPSGTCLNQNNLMSIAGNASCKLSHRPFSVTTKKQKYDDITTIRTNILRLGLPLEFGIFLTYYSALRFDDQPDYLYLRKLFRDLFIPKCYERGYVSGWETRDRAAPTTNQYAGRLQAIECVEPEPL